MNDKQTKIETENRNCVSSPVENFVSPNFAWTQEKPKTVGLYFRSNPGLQHEISEQIVFKMDDKLWTYHPHNEMSKRTEIEKMPDSFLWIQIPIPNHWKIDLDYDNKSKISA